MSYNYWKYNYENYINITYHVPQSVDIQYDSISLKEKTKNRTRDNFYFQFMKSMPIYSMIKFFILPVTYYWDSY